MFKGMIDRWTTNRQLAEVEEFLARMRSADAAELGMPVALVYNTAYVIEKQEGWDLFEPALVLAQDPFCIGKISRMAVAMQKENPASAVGLIVWAHSLRGIENFRVRSKAREVWKHLVRGFPFAKEAMFHIARVSGRVVNIDRLGDIPSGLSPDVA